ncbi:MAG TPA: hypothetical protein VGR53_10915 [Nitrososphaerales archaeon]|nr:hypothetical protein [Nitrososphaerales archaeon]
MAETSQQFEQATFSYKASFDSVFDSWSFDSSCNVTLTSVNIVFQLKNATGSAGYAIVEESPLTDSIFKVTLQQHNPSASTGSDSWSGYEMTGNADGTVAVYESIASWSIPTVSQPYGTACQTPAYCDLSVWPGLVRKAGGTSGIAQTGSDSKLFCTSVCGLPSANLWYEFFPQQSTEVDCNDYASPGDSVQAYVLNQGWNGGSTSLWNLQITDNTISQSCTVTGYSFNIGVPLLAEFLTERPKIGGAYSNLLQFNQFSITGNMYYSGATRGIYGPYSNGWYTLYVMEACHSTPPNITTGAVTSTNTFTQTYDNSNCA